AVESFDQDPFVCWDWCACGSVGLYLLNDSAYSVRVRGPYSRELLHNRNAGLVFIQQPIDLFPIFSHSDSKSARHGEYLPVPSRNGRGGIVNGQDVHLAIVGDLFHLPDPSLDDKVEADMGHC